MKKVVQENTGSVPAGASGVLIDRVVENDDCIIGQQR
jgi:hypothetical protein